MQESIEINVEIGEDHLIHVPADVPVGPAKLVVAVARPAAPAGPADLASARRAAMGMDDAGGYAVPEDFDALLPADVQRYFEGEDDEDGGVAR
jgi:hypothetical protein